MKTILLLLLISISFSCFAQENDRAVIVKNKVKSVTIKNNENGEVIDYQEFNIKGFKTKEKYFQRMEFNNDRTVIYNYDDTVLKTKIVFRIQSDSSEISDTTFYDYDKLGRLVSIYEPKSDKHKYQVFNRPGSLILFFYDNKKSFKIHKVVSYCTSGFTSNNECMLVYKDNLNYYLLGYKVYKYIDTQVEPLKYTFTEEVLKEGIGTGRFFNNDIDGEMIKISDTEYRYVARWLDFDSSYLSYESKCDQNEKLGSSNSYKESIAKYIKNSKVIKLVTTEGGTAKHVKIEKYNYFENELISDVFTTHGTGIISQYFENLYELNQYFKYSYDFNK